MSLSDVNIAKRKRLTLKGLDIRHRKSPEVKAPEILQPPPPVEEEKDLLTKLYRLFDLELVAAGKENLKLQYFTEDEKNFIDERAGIYQYEAGLSRDEAENKAISELKINKI